MHLPITLPLKDWERETYSMIGASLVVWAAFEKQVATNIFMIEGCAAMAAGVWPIRYTDIASFRDFKTRKGHLRGLAEKFGGKKELSWTDKAFRHADRHVDMRHGFAHDLTAAYIGKAGWPNIAADAKDEAIVEVRTLKASASGQSSTSLQYTLPQIANAIVDLKTATLLLSVTMSSIAEKIGPPMPGLGVAAAPPA